MAYLMKFSRKVQSIVGDEIDKSAPDDPSKRYYDKGKIYAIQPNDAAHFFQSGFATFVKNPKKK